MGAWYVAHVMLSEPPNLYSWLFNWMTLLVAGGVFFLVVACFEQGEGQPAAEGRTPSLAALTGALAMLLYDQVNMGLVTGPVAMLFWTLLFLAQPALETSSGPPRTRIGGWSSRGMVWFGLLLLAVPVIAWLPAPRPSMPWNVSSFELAASTAARDGKLEECLRNIDLALVLDQRSEPLWRWRIQVKRQLGKPIAEDIDHLLDLNRTGFRLWLDMGVMDSDWPREKRIAALKRARWLNEQLDKDEMMRLTATERERLESALQALEALR